MLDSLQKVSVDLYLVQGQDLGELIAEPQLKFTKPKSICPICPLWFVCLYFTFFFFFNGFLSSFEIWPVIQVCETKSFLVFSNMENLSLIYLHEIGSACPSPVHHLIQPGTSGLFSMHTGTSIFFIHYKETGKEKFKLSSQYILHPSKIFLLTVSKAL